MRRRFSARAAGHPVHALSLHSGSRLLERSVYFRDVRLGEIEDLLLDSDGRRLLGFAVLCGDGGHRILPLAAAEVGGGRVQAASALVLMDDAFYRKRCRTLTAYRGLSVACRGRHAGRLDDVLFDDDGIVRRLVVDGEDGAGEVAFDAGVVVDGGAKTRAV